MESFLNIIEAKRRQVFSLRIIDWFVTNYSKSTISYIHFYKTPEGKITFSSDGRNLQTI